jgi:hypothetical protein
VLDRLLPASNSPDSDRGSSSPFPAPSWPAVLACIAAFVLQYALSASLHLTLHGNSAVQAVSGGVGALPFDLPPTVLGLVPTPDVVLWAAAAAVYMAFDRTPAGLTMSLLTAVCGPLIEVALISGAATDGVPPYTYTHPDIAGIPTWIAAVYACGGPAVGNLGRRVWADLNAASAGQRAATGNTSGGQLVQPKGSGTSTSTASAKGQQYTKLRRPTKVSTCLPPMPAARCWKGLSRQRSRHRCPPACQNDAMRCSYC